MMCRVTCSLLPIRNVNRGWAYGSPPNNTRHRVTIHPTPPVEAA